ncbi:MAG TPA: pitrilysin family protein, partial [Candidatus Tectomicrobia bacterium]|nr:pitrilysin family protein [Candidatus Tectomicrobia bacterium]
AAELDRARPIVLARIRSRGDVPAQHAFDALLHDLYDGHPYRWPSVGRAEVVARLGRDELAAHHAALYRPDRMVLAVSGGVRAAPVFRTATRLFGSVAAPGPAAAPAAPAPAPRSDRRVLEHPAQQAQILVGFLAPPLSDPDYAAVRVLGTALGGGMAGRLFRELRDRQGLAYSVSVLGTYRTGPSFLAAYMGTAPANAAAAEAGVLRELDRVRREGVTASELARARAYLLGTLAMDRRTNARHAWYLAFFEVIGAGWDFPERYARAVEAVTLDDVRRVAERYLRAPTIVVLLPPGAGPR